jgi:hypothetical protein
VSELEAMTAAATAAAMAAPVRGEIRRTDPGNHYQATQLGRAPVDQMHLVCAAAGGKCGQSVAVLAYDAAAGGRFVYSMGQLVACVAAHVAQCHAGQVAPLPSPA